MRGLPSGVKAPSRVKDITRPWRASQRVASGFDSLDSCLARGGCARALLVTGAAVVARD